MNRHTFILEKRLGRKPIKVLSTLQFPTQQKRQRAEQTEQRTAKFAAQLRVAGIDFDQL